MGNSPGVINAFKGGLNCICFGAVTLSTLFLTWYVNMSVLKKLENACNCFVIAQIRHKARFQMDIFLSVHCS